MTEDRRVADLLEQIGELLQEIAWLRGALLPARQVSFQGLEGLGPGPVAILEALVQAECPVPWRTLARRVALATGRPEDTRAGAVAVAVCRLRRRLVDLDPPIAVHAAYRRGYVLDGKSKARLAARRRSDPETGASPRQSSLIVNEDLSLCSIC